MSSTVSVVSVVSVGDDLDVIVAGAATPPPGSVRSIATTKTGDAALWNVGVAHARAARLSFVGAGEAWAPVDDRAPALGFEQLLESPPVPAAAVVVPRADVLASGGFDERLPLASHHLWLRLAARGIPVHVRPIPVQPPGDASDLLAALLAIHEDLEMRVDEPQRARVVERVARDRRRLAGSLRARAATRATAGDAVGAGLDLRAAFRLAPLSPRTVGALLADAPEQLRAVARRLR